MPTSGGTATNLNYYEEYTDASFLFAGPWASAHDTELRIVRIGKVVHITVVGIIQDDNTSAIISSVIAIPTRFRPTETTFGGGIQVVNLGNDVQGWYEVGSGGFIDIYRQNGDAFSVDSFSALDTGFRTFSCSWVLT